MTRPKNEAEAYRLIDEFADKLRVLALDEPIPKAWGKRLRDVLSNQANPNPGRLRDIEVMTAYLIEAAALNPVILNAGLQALTSPPPEEPAPRGTVRSLATRFSVNETTIRRALKRVRSDPAMMKDAQDEVVWQLLQTALAEL